MPFTPSHAVVALPFMRTPLVPAAIAVGAMTPDLPIFVRGLGLSYTVTHSFAWLPLTICVALLLLLAWRCVLRPGVRELVPAGIAARVPQAWDAPAGAALRETFASRRRGASPDEQPSTRPTMLGALLLLLSLAIGVVSHIVWDAFTHVGRAGVSWFPMLDERWGPLPGYKWLQYASGVFGLAVIGIWAVRWIARRSPHGLERVVPTWLRVVVWASLPIGLAIAFVAGLVVLGPLRPEFGVAHLAYVVLPPACAAWGALVVAVSIGVQVARRRGR